MAFAPEEDLMRTRCSGFAAAILVTVGLCAHADARIPNAHGNCAMPMRGFFRMADLDKNGDISRAEWLKMFSLIDRNHDGVLDAREIEAFERNGMAMTQQMLMQGSRQAPAAATRPH
jgi:hypothetical protein